MSAHLGFRITDHDLERLDAMLADVGDPWTRSSLINRAIRRMLAEHEGRRTRSSEGRATPATGGKASGTRSARPALAVVDGGEDAHAGATASHVHAFVWDSTSGVYRCRECPHYSKTL